VYEHLYDDIFQELAGISLPPKPDAASDQSSVDVTRFAGVYERLGTRMTFEVVDGRLQLQTENTGPLSSLRPEAPPILLDAVDDIWGSESESALVSKDVLRALAHSGNYVVGAFLDGRMVGISVGFLGQRNGHPHLHSHISGVAPDSQRRHIGFALKQHQRAWC